MQFVTDSEVEEGSDEESQPAPVLANDDGDDAEASDANARDENGDESEAGESASTVPSKTKKTVCAWTSIYVCCVLFDTQLHM